MFLFYVGTYSVGMIKYNEQANKNKLIKPLWAIVRIGFNSLEGPKDDWKKTKKYLSNS